MDEEVPWLFNDIQLVRECPVQLADLRENNESGANAIVEASWSVMAFKHIEMSVACEFISGEPLVQDS